MHMYMYIYIYIYLGATPSFHRLLSRAVTIDDPWGPFEIPWGSLGDPLATPWGDLGDPCGALGGLLGTS